MFSILSELNNSEGLGGKLPVVRIDRFGNIITNLAGLDKDKYAVQINGRKYMLNYCPNYDTIEEKHAKPDFRSTLYWNPDLKTDENGESRFSFYTSDEKGKYCMQIEGISSDGKPVSGKYYFTVD